MDVTPLTLLERMKIGDNHAWEQFHDLYRALLWTTVNRLLGRVRAQAEWAQDDHRYAADVFQETLLKVLQSLPRFERQRDGSFRTWLRTIAQNKTLAELRKPANRPSSWSQQDVERLCSLAEDPRNDLQLLVEDEYNAHVRATLVRWLEKNPGEKVAPLMRLVSGEAAAPEVARDLGIPLKTVYVQKHRLLKRLREHFDSLRDFL